jgi:glycogen operon protein
VAEGVRGTYLGLIDLIPHFQELGITAVELLPVQSFDRSADGRINPLTGQPLSNYWGYSTVNFFSPEAYYSQNQALAGQVHEFKTMVRELHKAGIEVILDVVYNHTAEGNQLGTTFSFRGIDNLIYYLLENDQRYYSNYSGTGNTFNCNHPVVRDLILDSLRYWVVEMHVDGFRFDLASILGRDQRGNLLENPPIVERIAEDPILRNTKIIAEAWDAAGAYQVGSFPGGRWAEWNGRYRDDVRSFWRGDSGKLGALATRFAGSSDLYLRDGRSPFHSINFITSHDGFTLNDLVSYNNKHNMGNGENNRDGDNNNHSDNMGVEGPTKNARVEAYRLRRLKNMMTTLLLSQGVPMLLAGDEFRRTQKGNNNAYAQDNPISWIDWSLKETHSEFYRFVRELVAFRKRHPIFYRPHFFSGGDGGNFDIQWFSETCEQADWGEYTKTLTCLLFGHQELIGENRSDNDVLVMFNVSPETRYFSLPPAPHGRVWKLAIDTALPQPFDICLPGEEMPMPSQSRYKVKDHSVVVLLAFQGFEV